jgi:predicted dehydrogenase
VIRVGVVGASPHRGWAFAAHVPALQTLPSEYEIVAVATTREESAREAARLVGATHVFADGVELARHPDVDLVAVVVRVAAHAATVEAALAAGKHVYCEWPLATTSREAEPLAAAAQRVDVHTAAGLQARCSPVLQRARTLLEEGYVGEVRSAAVYSSHPFGAGGVVPADTAFTLNEASGMTLLAVTGGHTVDAVEFLLGPLVEVSARVAGSGRTYRIEGTDEQVVSTAPTDLLLDATSASGATASLHVHNGATAGARTRIEIAGTDSKLVIAAEGGRAGIQMGDLHLSADVGARSLPAVVGNVAELYRRLAADIEAGTHTVPDFAHALRLHRLLETIQLASDTGRRLQLPV